MKGVWCEEVYVIPWLCKIVSKVLQEAFDYANTGVNQDLCLPQSKVLSLTEYPSALPASLPGPVASLK